jgi:hypothetical protein
MDVSSNYLNNTARDDFERARRKAFMDEIKAFLHRRPNDLMSFDEVQRALPIQGQIYRGIRQVPVADIMGSVDRYQDFNRNFLPVQTHTRPRWEAIDRATLAQETLPPVQLYQVGDIYFVKDGNHRVSVARERGQEMIDAEVSEWPTNVPITSQNDARDLLRLGEYARFLEETRLDRLRPGMHIEFTTLGRYDVLLEHISAHRWYMGVDQQREISWEEAVLDWYDHVYSPLIQVIEETGILKDFPGRTAADLYLWIMDHRYYLEREAGHPVGPTTAVMSYDAEYGRWTRRVRRSLQRLLHQERDGKHGGLLSPRRIRSALAALRPGSDE